MFLSFSYDLNKQFEYASDLLGQLEFEISLKNKVQTIFSGGILCEIPQPMSPPRLGFRRNLVYRVVSP